jgi:hypothetical protein
MQIGHLQGNRHLQRVLAGQKYEIATRDEEVGQEVGATPETTLQRQPAAPAPPPRVSVTPLAISVGTRQKFPLRYSIQNFTETDQIGGSATIHTAPANVIEDIRIPTSPNETGNMILEAEAREGRDADHERGL